MANDSHLLTDIRLGLEHHELRPVYSVSTDGRRLPTRPGVFVDMGTVSGRDNLSQAAIMRLLTPRGELAALGHPEFGSRLHEMVGRENTETNRNLLRLYILESLALEPRISEARVVSVEPDVYSRDRVNVRLEVVPTDETETVTIGPFTLEF